MLQVGCKPIGFGGKTHELGLALTTPKVADPQVKLESNLYPLALEHCHGKWLLWLDDFAHQRWWSSKIMLDYRRVAGS
jgi:hypothetical protein